MRAYIAFSKGSGPEDGAILVFHNTAREAKKLVYGACDNVDDWLDQGIRWLRDKDVFRLGNLEKLKTSTPHMVYDPASCQSCDLWGCGLTNGLVCSWCGGEPGERLIYLLTTPGSELLSQTN